VAPPPKPKPAPPAADAGAAPTAGGDIPAAPEPAWGGMEMKQLGEKEWLAGVREKVSQRLKVEPTELRFSPIKQLVAFVRMPEVVAEKRPPKHPVPRQYHIVVVDTEGRPRAAFRSVTVRGSDEPPKDLHFLSEDRLVYEVVMPPPPPKPPRKSPPPPKPKARARAAPARGPAGKKPEPPPRPLLEKVEWPPKRLFVIQPVVRGARPIRCEGVRFASTVKQDHLAFVAGKPEAAFVSVDGVQVYPRKGRTIISSDPAWGKDGLSLAFLEVPPAGVGRLVLLAEFDNPTGDTLWDLPPSATLDGVRVFWAGPGKLVVGKTQMRPVFATSFVKETPPPPMNP
jgi:hypothetical protein